jgi:hypothetical protein
MAATKYCSCRIVGAMHLSNKSLKITIHELKFAVGADKNEKVIKLG